MSEPAVLLCGHGSRDPEAIEEFEQAAAALRAPPRWPRLRDRLSRIRPADNRRGARRLAGARRGRHTGDAGHAVRREPRQERPAVGDEQLHGGAARGRGAARPRSRRSTRNCSRRRPTASPPSRRRRNAPDSLLRRRRPRHQRPGRQRQHREGRAHAVGRAGLRLGRGGVQRRRASAGRRGARPRGAARLPPHRRVSVFPVHRSPGQAHLRRRPTPPPPASRRSSSSRPTTCATIRRSSTPFSTASTSATTGDAGDELPALQIPHAHHRLR